MNAAIIVEGPTDKLLFSFLASWLKKRGINTVLWNAKGRPELIKNAERYVSAARKLHCDLVVLVIDQDDDNCAPESADRLSRTSANDVLVVVACRCLEAWLLADETAVRHVSGAQYTIRSATDSLPHPDDVLRDILYRAKKQFLSKSEIVERFLPHFDIERAKLHNRSLCRLTERLSSRLQSSF